MSIPKDAISLVKKDFTPIDIENLIDELKTEDKRVLVDDEIGTMIYVGDLEIYTIKETTDGSILQKVSVIRNTKFRGKIIRLQIGGVVASYTPDTIFYVFDNKDRLIKIRADKLKNGMITKESEKVFIL